MNNKMHAVKITIGIALIALVLVACGSATPTIAKVVPTAAAPTSSIPPNVVIWKTVSLGSVLADVRGKTLYIYTKDAPGVSNCYDTCAINWPPFTLAAGVVPTGSADITAVLGTITRTDGAIQVTVNNMPVYFYIKDTSLGAVTGQGVGGVWFVLDPTGAIFKK
jgi:predicted lipoprotein with Yx(FWY)xxD motif